MKPFGGCGETRLQKDLIQDCEANHAACRTRGSVFLPTRLIDVRKYPKVCLVQNLPHDSVQDQRYIALTYCWGPNMPEEGKSTSSRLEPNKIRIDVRKLPKTIKDAIDFTHCLDVPFLWVDSLCIIQDNEIDWEREAATMASVYAMAYVTLAAASSNHCNGGFLKASYSEMEIQIARRVNRLGQPEDVYTPTSGRDFSSVALVLFATNPLFSRGWTLQERELSPRVIHFTRSHVFWECRQRVCAYIRPQKGLAVFRPQINDMCKDAPWLVWPLRCFDVPTKGPGYSLAPWDRKQHWEPTSIQFDTWQSLIEGYSRRHLTVASDKIAAINGVADSLKGVFKCDYLAGLWRDNLLKDLLWFRSGNVVEHEQHHPSMNYAPSWSWAWTNFRIEFSPLTNVDDAEILKAIVTRNGTKTKGCSGFITLRSRVVDGLNNPGVKLLLDSGKKKDSMTCKYSGGGEDDLTICILRTCNAVPDRWGGVAREYAGHLIPGTPVTGTGLILHRVEGTPSTYKRVGFANLVPLKSFENLKHRELTII